MTGSKSDLTVVLAMVGQSIAPWGLPSPLQFPVLLSLLKLTFFNTLFCSSFTAIFVWEHLERNPFLHVLTPLLCLKGFIGPAGFANYPLICSQSGLE